MPLCLMRQGAVEMSARNLICLVKSTSYQSQPLLLSHKFSVRWAFRVCSARRIYHLSVAVLRCHVLPRNQDVSLSVTKKYERDE
jgi:hypothetical protein